MENSNDDIRVFLSSPQSLDLIEKFKIKPKIKSKRKKRKVVSKKLLIKNILMEEDLSKLTERQKILNKKFRDNARELDDISLINSGIDIIPYNINNVTVLGRFMESKEDEEGENKKDKRDDKEDFSIKDSTKKRKLIKEERLGTIYYKKLYEDSLNRIKPVNKRLCTIKLRNISNIYKIQIPLSGEGKGDREMFSNGDEEVNKEESRIEDEENRIEEGTLGDECKGSGKEGTLGNDCKEEYREENEEVNEDKEELIEVKGDNEVNFSLTKDFVNKDLPFENKEESLTKIQNDFKVPVSIEVIPLVQDFTKIRLKISKKPFLSISNHILRIPIDHPPSLINYPITLYPKNHLPFLQNFLLYKKEKEIYAKKCLFLSCLCKNMKNFPLKYEEDQDQNLDQSEHEITPRFIKDQSEHEITPSFIKDQSEHEITPSFIKDQPSLSENKISCLMKISMYLELIQISLKIHKCEVTGLLIEKLKIILERINNSKCVCDIEERIMNVLTKADQCKKCKYEK